MEMNIELTRNDIMNASFAIRLMLEQDIKIHGEIKTISALTGFYETRNKLRVLSEQEHIKWRAEQPIPDAIADQIIFCEAAIAYFEKYAEQLRDLRNIIVDDAS